MHLMHLMTRVDKATTCQCVYVRKMERACKRERERERETERQKERAREQKGGRERRRGRGSEGEIA